MALENVLEEIEAYDQEVKNLQEVNKDGFTIPEPYLIKGAWLYYEKEKKNNKGEVTGVEHLYVTSTPPVITKRYRDIETKEFYYEMEFKDKKRKYKLPVTAQEITQSKYLVELAGKGLDVTQNEARQLVHYLSKFRLFNNVTDYDVATRLGDVKGHFISPYKQDQEENSIYLFNMDSGYQSVIDAFETTGNIEDYIEGVFKPLKNNPMAMMVFYGSLGSILLKDFDVDPFVVDLSSKTSTGKTFSLNIAASVWGNRRLITEWNATDNSIERMASFLNSFPMIKDDTRKANKVDKIPSIVYQFSGGQSKGRANSTRSIDYMQPWHNIMLSTGEVSIPDLSKEKAGVAGRVLTLQDEPFPNIDVSEFGDIAECIEANHGLLGKLFIEQYGKKKDAYKESYKSYVKIFMKKADGNEIMTRIARSFAVLQTTGEILNDIDGFEHDFYSIADAAHKSMVDNNKNIDKPKQLLEGLLQYLDANRNNIEGDGYHDVSQGDVKAVYKKEYLCVLSETVKTFLGNELVTITKEWQERGYITTDKERRTKRVGHKGKKVNGYAINNDVINELGFEFIQTSLPHI